MATILVVDDWPANRQLMLTLLGTRGHRVLEAGNGAEALERVRADQPDLVLTDILMPTMDGYDFVRRLRGDPDVSHTRVVFYAATYLETEARVLAQSCGVTRVIGKPIDPEEVLSAVDECLSSGSESVPPSATLPEDGKDRHIRVLSNNLLEKIAELKVRNDELESSNLDLEKEMATRTHADEELRAANEKLSKSLSDLRRWNHEVALLSEMGQLLDSCLTTEEAHAVVKQFGEKLHIGDSGCVYLLDSSRNLL
jgi:CheY-like chemotaxis protein